MKKTGLLEKKEVVQMETDVEIEEATRGYTLKIQSVEYGSQNDEKYKPN